MKLRSNPFLASLLVAGGLAFAVPAVHAHPGGGGFGGGFGGGEPRAGMHSLRRLDLSEAQRDQIFKLFHDQAPAMRERMKAARDAREELRKAATAATFDGARVRQLADAAGKAHADAAYARAETMSKVAALLTPEQRARLEQSRSQWRERGPRRGHR